MMFTDVLRARLSRSAATKNPTSKEDDDDIENDLQLGQAHPVAPTYQGKWASWLNQLQASLRESRVCVWHLS